MSALNLTADDLSKSGVIPSDFDRVLAILSSLNPSQTISTDMYSIRMDGPNALVTSKVTKSEFSMKLKKIVDDNLDKRNRWKQYREADYCMRIERKFVESLIPTKYQDLFLSYFLDDKVPESLPPDIKASFRFLKLYLPGIFEYFVRQETILDDLSLDSRVAEIFRSFLIMMKLVESNPRYLYLVARFGYKNFWDMLTIMSEDKRGFPNVDELRSSIEESIKDMSSIDAPSVSKYLKKVESVFWTILLDDNQVEIAEGNETRLVAQELFQTFLTKVFEVKSLKVDVSENMDPKDAIEVYKLQIELMKCSTGLMDAMAGLSRT